MEVEPGAPGPERDGDGDAEGVGSLAGSADVPAAAAGEDFAGGMVGDAEGAREKGAGLGGATEVPKSIGGVFGLDCAIPKAGIDGDSERAFFEGDGTFSPSPPSSSSSSLYAGLARGELLAGRVDGRTPRNADDADVPGADAGGADVARGTAAGFETASGDTRSSGEPGGVVLPSRTRTGLDGSPSFSFPLSLGGVGGVKLIPEKIEGGVFGGAACLTVGDSGAGWEEVVASSSSSSSSSSTSGGTSSSSLPRSSSSDFRNASMPSSTSSSSSCDRKDVSAPSSSSASASASSSSSLPAST